MKTNQTCSNCLYSEVYTIHREFSCRRYPPLVVQGTYGNISTHFPRTVANDWCGEWVANHRTPEIGERTAQ